MTYRTPRGPMKWTGTGWLPDGQPAPTPSATTAPAALPPSAAGQLKEGVETKFGNGQVWTKRGGVSVQVQ